MLPDAFKSVATENEISCDGVIKRFDTEMVARTKKPLFASVPNGKSEVSVDVPDTIVCPREKRMEDQFGIARIAIDVLTGLRKFIFQFAAAIQPRVGHDPRMPVEAYGLALITARSRGAKQRVPKTYGSPRPLLTAIRPTKRKKRSEAAKQGSIHRRATALKECNETAQRISFAGTDVASRKTEKLLCSSPA